MPTLDDFDASIGIKRAPEPGDPDYSWSANAGYDPKDKLVGEAKQTLAKSQQLADSSGLTQIEQNPPASIPQPPSSADTLGNFLKNAWQAFPLNPSNVVESAKAMVPGTEANQRYQQSLYEHPIMSALREASPLTGGAGLQAGQRIAQGDVSGGLGELAGEMGGAALPLVLPEIPGAIRTATDATGRGIGAVGRGMEAIGASAPARAGGNLATLNAIVRPGWGSVATATIPPAFEYGGRGLQRIGEMIQGLAKETPNTEPFGPINQRLRVSTEVPGFSYQEPPASQPPQSLGLPPGQYTGPQTLQTPLAIQGLKERLALPPASSIQGPQTLHEPLRLPAGPTRLSLPPASSIQLGSSGQMPIQLGAGDLAGQHMVEGMLPTNPEDLVANIRTNANYGEGAVLQNHLPTEYLPPEEVMQTYDQSAGGMYPTVHVPSDFSIEGVSDTPSSAGNRANLQPTLAKLEQAQAGLKLKDNPLFAQLPSDADVAQAVAAKNAKTTPAKGGTKPKSSGARTLNDAMKQWMGVAGSAR